MRLTKFIRVAAIVAVAWGAAGIASATTYTYNLFDHPLGAKAASYDYGLRLDAVGKFFSFETGTGSGVSLAQLTYNDMTNTASITGQMRDNFDDSLWDISFSLTGTVDIPTGYFTTNALGTGSITDGLATTYNLTGKSRGDASFLFGINLGGKNYPGLDGAGWVTIDGLCGPGTNTGCSGANDFLFTAAPIPVPAALPLALLAFASLGAMRLRRRHA